jgi:hypothetical protein
MRSALQLLLICLILSEGIFPSPSSHVVGRALAIQDDTSKAENINVDKEDKEDVPEDGVETPPSTPQAPSTVPQEDVQGQQNQSPPPSSLAPSGAMEGVDNVATSSTLAPTVVQEEAQEEQDETSTPTVAPEDVQDDVPSTLAPTVVQSEGQGGQDETSAPTVSQEDVQEDQNESPPEENVQEDDIETPPPTTAAPTGEMPTIGPEDLVDGLAITASTDIPSTAPQETVVSNKMIETPLPEIYIDLKVTGIIEPMESIETTSNCYFFLQNFIETLLTSSRVMSATSLNSTSLEIQLISDTEAETTGVTATSRTVESGDSAVRFVIGGTVFHYPRMTIDTDEQNDWEDSVSYGLLVYLTLWGTDDFEQSLEQACELFNAQVTSVWVDGKIVEIPEDILNNGITQPPTETAAATSILSLSAIQFLSILVVGRILLCLMA